ncbi:MAG TPA: hypothetical protein PL057_03000 [Bacillota bacterium]|nr:hypothetical protein [Bacillota bacterium]
MKELGRAGKTIGVKGRTPRRCAEELTKLYIGLWVWHFLWLVPVLVLLIDKRNAQTADRKGWAFYLLVFSGMPLVFYEALVLGGGIAWARMTGTGPAVLLGKTFVILSILYPLVY